MKKQLWTPPAQKIEPMSNGILGLHDNVSPVSRPLGMLSYSKNVERYGVTGVTTRTGRSRVGNQVGAGPILGLATLYIYSSGTLVKRLVAACLDTWKCYNPATSVWDTLDTSAVFGGLTTGKQVNTINFNDYMVLTNLANKVMTYNGATTPTAVADLAGSPPKAQFIATAYKRVFLGGVAANPHLLYVSDTANMIEWTNQDSAAIPINDKDGDEIKWMLLYGSYVYVYKRYSLHEIHGPELGKTTGDWAVYQVVPMGTPNGRTIAELKKALYWLSDSRDAKGVVRWSGGQPEVISSPVQGYIDRINYSAISVACATSNGDGLYLLSVPLDAATTPSVALVYDTNDGAWWAWEDWKPTCFASYRLADKELALLGDNDGYVYSMSGRIDET